MKKLIFFIPITLLFLSLTSAITFKHNEVVNYTFRCLDTSNNYCDSGTQVLINVDNPNGLNVINNQSMTWSATSFSYSLPTNPMGKYNVLIISPSAANSTTEFTYDVTGDGSPYEEFPMQLIILFIGYAILILGTIFSRFGYGLINYVGAAIVVIMGVLTLYPGYSYIDHSTLLGITLGFTSIGLGAFFLFKDTLYGGDN